MKFAELFPLRKRQGLTLIGLMLALALLGLLATWGLSKLPLSLRGSTSSEAIAARKDMESIMQGLVRYRLDNGTYPTTEQGLLALVLKPTTAPAPQRWQLGGYVKRLPRDPWGHSYHYRLQDNDAILISYGAQGPLHGADDPDNTIIRIEGKHYTSSP